MQNGTISISIVQRHDDIDKVSVCESPFTIVLREIEDARDETIKSEKT